MVDLKRIIKRVLARQGYVVYRIGETLKSSQTPKALPAYSPTEHNSVQRINEFYADEELRAVQLDSTRFELYHEILEVALQHGVTFEGKDVCDVGCGTGHLLSLVQQRFSPRSLAGFDVSVEALKVAQDVVTDAVFRECDVNNAIDGSFDVVLCSEVLEHLLHPQRALRTILSLVRPGGFAVLTVPDGRHDRYHGHINFWSPESWRVFLETADSLEVKAVGMCEAKRCNYAILATSEKS